jgi:hypothetical protein
VLPSSQVPSHQRLTAPLCLYPERIDYAAGYVGTLRSVPTVSRSWRPRLPAPYALSHGPGCRRESHAANRRCRSRPRLRRSAIIEFLDDQ